MSQAIAGYRAAAASLIEAYETINVEVLFEPVRAHVPQAGETVLDIGAGTGRDAAYWTAKGCEVTAVDPVAELWAHQEISPIRDCLPKLSMLEGHRFDVVTAIGVLHHLDPDDQIAALVRLGECLHPGGRMILSLRHGETAPHRPGYKIDVDVLLSAQSKHGLRLLQRTETGSMTPLNIAAGVRWTWLVLQLVGSRHDE